MSDKRKASGSKIGGVLNALKRVSFTRRSSSDSLKETPKETNNRPTIAPNSSSRRRSTSSLAPSTVPSVGETPSLRPTLHRLNSSSPASELPKTWAEWTLAYRQGLIDFSDPPEPPSDLHASEYRTTGGLFSAPLPATEAARQRAVDRIALLHKKKSSNGLKQDLSTTTSTYPDGTGAPLDDKLRSTPEVEELESFNPKALPTYNVLEELARKAQDRFDVETASVSLMDRDQQLFLAKTGFLPPGDVATTDRQESCCSHTILKAASTGEKEPLVVLDFSKDWRFKTNTFGDHSSGFYAAAPILLPSALGDGEGAQAGGVFCVLGKSARSTFSNEDRLDLEKMADEASKEIQRWADQSRQEKKAEMSKKRKQYKHQIKRTASQTGNLDTVDEIPTPPLTPDMSNHQDEFQLDSTDEPPRRPSLAESTGSLKSLDLKTTSATPAFPKRRGRQGVSAQSVVPLPDEHQAVIDLSTQLVAESIEMEFSYVVAIDLSTAPSYDPDALSSKNPSPLRFVSVHGLPIPAPLFSVKLHLETLTSPHNALLYVNDDYTGIAGEFATGLLVKIGTIGQTGYVLGTFTEDQSRVLNQEDLLFVRSFARDINRQLQPK